MISIQQSWLGSLEVTAVNGTGHRFAKHSHDELVIGANLVGEEHIWLDGRSFTATPGSITLYNPGQVQGGGVADGAPWQYVGLYIDAGQLGQNLDLPHVEFNRALCHQPEFVARLESAIRRAAASDGLIRERAEEALILLLGDIVALSGTRLAVSQPMGLGLIGRIKELLAEHLHRTVSLDALANELQLSKFHLLRAFQKETGLSPRQWSMQLRTRRAQGLLRIGVSATDAAHAVGFVDQSHLNRHFRAAYGITPGTFQRLPKS